ncbi:hypothetical protein ACG02S_07930 [Roseateles sp. DC23W]|uniref:Uncharacterized protein n=1 Tax=Pelomonas dachongensis TaxID=3299029 RepID=A0ABW7EME8_9BURK
MSDRHTPVVTPEHTQRAYAQLRRADWPPLDEMARWAKQYAIVTARASSLAHGRTLPPEPAAAPAPAPASPRALGRTERRRRDDRAQAFDARAAAAGEFLHDDDA